MRTILQISLVLRNPITGIKVRDHSGDDLHTEHIDENRHSVTHFLTQVYAQWDKIILEITITSILLSNYLSMVRCPVLYKVSL